MTRRPGKFIAVAGQRLEYRWHGPAPAQAPTLVFLHDGLGSAELWRDFPQALADACGYGALVYSRAGYGRSDPVSLPRGKGFLEVEGLAVLPKVLAALGVENHILVGHSDGGSIALVNAGGAASRGLRGVITEAAHVFNETLTVASIKEVTPLYEKGGLKQRLANYHEHVDIAFYGWHDTWLSDAFRTWTIERYLATISVPVLVLQGEGDPFGTPKQVEAIVSQVGDAQAVLIPDCAHTPHRERPGRVLELMTSFIRNALDI